MTEQVRPEILELIELGNGFGSIKIEPGSPESIREQLLALLQRSRERQLIGSGEQYTAPVTPLGDLLQSPSVGTNTASKAN